MILSNWTTERPIGLGLLRARVAKRPWGLSVHERNNLQIKSLTAVEMIEQDDVREAIEILQPCMVLFKNPIFAVNTCGTCRLNRYAFWLGERRVDDPNGFKFNQLLLHFIYNDFEKDI